MEYFQRKQVSEPAAGRRDMGIYAPRRSLCFDEEWVDDYVEENLHRGLAGYCWDWLDSGCCAGCGFKHSYPRTWYAAMRRRRRREGNGTPQMRSMRRDSGRECIALPDRWSLASCIHSYQ